MLSTSLNSSNLEQRASVLMVTAALIVIFAATHGWALLSWNALYWDDWSILTANTGELHRMFKFVGFELTGYLHSWLVPLGAGAYKVLMLSSFALMSMCVFFITHHYGLRATQAGLVTALFIVAPLNSSKIAAINAAAVMFAATFFLAWLLLLSDLQKPLLLKRLCALILFSISFYLPSSLAFFALPAISIAWSAYQSADIWKQRLGVVAKRIDFLTLPLIQFTVFRLYFFKPDASIAKEYHQFGIRTSRLHEALGRIQTDILFDMPWALRSVLLVLPFLILLRFAKHPPLQRDTSIRYVDLCMCIGLSACFFALLPYVAVGRLPVFSDWNSRYQLFLPLGYALICWSMSQYIAIYTKNIGPGVIAYALIFLMSTAFSVGSYFEYADDWRKQNQLMAALQQQTKIKSSENVVFVDHVVYAKRRAVRYNEYTQMLMQAQPGWRGTAVSYSQLQVVGAGSLKRYLASLGTIDGLQADPKIFGLSADWVWNDSCLVFVAFEIEGHVELRPAKNNIVTRQPCDLSPIEVY